MMYFSGHLYGVNLICYTVIMVNMMRVQIMADCVREFPYYFQRSHSTWKCMTRSYRKTGESDSDMESGEAKAAFQIKNVIKKTMELSEEPNTSGQRSKGLDKLINDFKDY